MYPLTIDVRSYNVQRMKLYSPVDKVFVSPQNAYVET